MRHRGTLGGSLAHGDPAGDVPAVILALDATFVARGPGGEREIPAAQFVDYLTTALAPDEIRTGISVPKLDQGWGYRYEQFHRTAQAWGDRRCRRAGPQIQRSGCRGQDRPD